MKRTSSEMFSAFEIPKVKLLSTTEIKAKQKMNPTKKINLRMRFSMNLVPLFVKFREQLKGKNNDKVYAYI